MWLFIASKKLMFHVEDIEYCPRKTTRKRLTKWVAEKNPENILDSKISENEERISE